jgi:uncharacterized peroxidase-related enzyme
MMRSFIKLPAIAAATGKRKELYDRIQADRGEGNISSVFQSYGAIPEVGMLVYKRLIALIDNGRLSKTFKETIMVALSEVNECDTCISFHGTAIKKLGVTDEQVDAIRRLDITPLGFSKKEQALFELAIKVNGEAHSVTLADWDHLRDDLGATDEEIMETLETVNFGNSVNLITCAIGGGKEEWYTYNMEDFEAEEAPEAAE